MRQNSRIKVIDSTLGGEASPLKQSIYAIVYVPSWLLVKYKFKWSSDISVLKSLSLMKEYFTSASFQDRPFRAQRCVYSLKAINIFGYKRNDMPRFSPASRYMLGSYLKGIQGYLQDNPVVAWDWVVSWTETRAMAEAYPDELVKLFRKLRSHRDTKRKPKPELNYFLNIIQIVAWESQIDLEYK